MSLLQIPRRSVWPAIVIYAVLAGRLAWWARDHTYTDAVAYMQLAEYLARGELERSVSAYWSPLISWCMAPLIRAGMYGAYAGRIVLFIWGVLLIFAGHRLVATLTRCSGVVHTLINCLVAVQTAQVVSWFISPDLLLATLLTIYFSVIVSEKYLESRCSQVMAGLLGGGAYLAKSFAFPYFLVHSTATVLLSYLLTQPRGAWRKSLTAWLVTMGAFWLVALPWIGVLTARYGNITFSIAGGINHTIIGPSDINRQHTFWEMAEPNGWDITIWERPEQLTYHPWSPFESWDYFKHQVRQGLYQGVSLVADIADFDLLHVTLPCLVLLPLLVIARTHDRWLWFRSLWGPLTVILYTAPFLLVFYTSRYLVTCLWPVCCIYSVGLCGECADRIRQNDPSARTPSKAIIAILIISFLLGGLTLRYRHFNFLPMEGTERPGGRTRKVAEVIRSAEPRGRFASSHYTADLAMRLAYFFQQPFVGVPQTGSTEEIEAQLDRFQVEWFLLEAHDPYYTQFQAETSWHKAFTVDDGAEQYCLYRRPAAGETRDPP